MLTTKITKNTKEHEEKQVVSTDVQRRFAIIAYRHCGAIREKKTHFAFPCTSSYHFVFFVILW